MRAFGIFVLCAIGAGLVLVVVVLLGSFLALRGSLPPLDGERDLPGLTAPAELARDSLGIAVVRAGSMRDALRAQGYAHAQDRYFQMDLLRRYVAGELAALLGPDLLAADREMRAYGYRGSATLHARELPVAQRALLEAYTEGVNAGLASLRRAPPEYYLLRATPEDWRAEDSLLVFLYFYIALSPHYREEIRHLPLHVALHPALAAFLTPDVSRFDTPVPGTGAGDPTGGYRPPPIPGPGVVDLRGTPRPVARRPPIAVYSDPPGGSNSWALADPDGGPALLANDPHLPIQVPGIWYRVELHLPGGVTRGASAPGLPGVLIGASDRLAWGVTAAMVDQTDVVLVEADPSDTLRYLTAAGSEAFHVRTEVLEARERQPDTAAFLHTRWGPVLGSGPDGRHLALRSPAFDAGGLTLAHLELPGARTVDDGIRIAREVGGPGLNLVFADADGRIGWTVSGVLPERRGTEGRVPVESTRPGLAWPGIRDEEERPVVLDPPGGVLFSANQRFLPLAEARRFSHLWISPARARRISELLEADGGTDLGELGHLVRQLDARSLEHDLARDIVLEVVPEDEPHVLLAEIRRYAEEWDGTARADLPHFRIVAEVSRHLRDGVLRPLLAPALEADADFLYSWFLAHEPAHRILETRPAHLLPGDFESWEDFLRQLVLEAGNALITGPGRLGLDTPWGEANRARFRHPFGELHAVLGRILNLPADPLPGFLGAVRAQAPGYGQSLRLVVRPGAPETALFQMPGGQSGHFLSRFYTRGHRAWVEGEPAPLAAGPDRHLLRLTPPEP